MIGYFILSKNSQSIVVTNHCRHIYSILYTPAVMPFIWFICMSSTQLLLRAQTTDNAPMLFILNGTPKQ